MEECLMLMDSGNNTNESAMYGLTCNSLLHG